MNNVKRNIVIGIICLFSVVLLQAGFLFFFYNRGIKNCESVTSMYWSAMGGKADERLVLDSNDPTVSQRIKSPHNALEQVILFFYHCDVPDSGKLIVSIKDAKGNVLAENSVDLAYYNEDVLCSITDLQDIDPGKEKEFEVVITISDIGDDHIEVGIASDPSKPRIFESFSNGTALFTGIKCTYTDNADLIAGIKKFIAVFSFIDILCLIWIIGIVSKKYKISVILSAALLICIGAFFGYSKFRQSREWYERFPYISHALGSTESEDFMMRNSYEAFERSYAGGYKVFEVDFAQTSDGKIALKHDWLDNSAFPDFEDGYVPTLDEFLNAKQAGQYTTMDINMLLDMMVEHKDIYVVTDSKESGFGITSKQFTEISEALENYTPAQRRHIKDHMIVQIYNDDMYYAIENTFDAEHYIYTIYQRGNADNLDSLFRFCRDNDIPVITVPFKWWDERLCNEMNDSGFTYYLHTLNDPKDIASLFEAGADGVYVDEPDLNDLKKEIQNNKR
ncbi:MAG: hypothetical protein K6G75_06260 [Lachnospiraceae bacterium]|nr:hypothetical protein [Lachnospiraceae bacterium]